MHLLHRGLSKIIGMVGDYHMRLRPRNRDIDEPVALRSVEEGARRVYRVEYDQEDEKVLCRLSV